MVEVCGIPVKDLVLTLSALSAISPPPPLDPVLFVPPPIMAQIGGRKRERVLTPVKEVSGQRREGWLGRGQPPTHAPPTHAPSTPTPFYFLPPCTLIPRTAQRLVGAPRAAPLG